MTATNHINPKICKRLCDAPPPTDIFDIYSSCVLMGKDGMKAFGRSVPSGGERVLDESDDPYGIKEEILQTFLNNMMKQIGMPYSTFKTEENRYVLPLFEV